MRDELINHLNDILNDDAPLPRELAIEKYADALIEFFLRNQESLTSIITRYKEELEDLTKE